MHIAIFSPYATVIPHFETELDIAQKHLDAGDTVEFINCEGELSNCDFNVDREQARCDECIGRRRMGLELLSPQPRLQTFSKQDIPAEPIPVVAAKAPTVRPPIEEPDTNLRPSSRADSGDYSESQSATCNGTNQIATKANPDSQLRTNFKSVEDLISYKVDNFDIGYAVLSSVVSTCRDPEPDLQLHDAMLQRFLRTAWDSYHQTLNFILKKQAAEEPLDRIYIYNGRFAAMRGVFRACQKLGVDCYLHERGCDANHYELLKNHLPHDIKMIEKAIRDGWNAADSDPNREEIASGWFHDRVNRVEKVWHSFVKGQKRGLLPDGFNPSKKNISIFCSSDDEFVAIGKAWQNEIYENQVVATEAIAKDLLKAQPESKIYLRVHPNLKGVKSQRLADMLALDYPNLVVIPPDGEVDTYALVKASDTVVSFGSSVGNEAIFWGRPSVLLGRCFYENLGGLYRSHSHQETIELLCHDLEPLDTTGALMYGYWFQTRGFPHKYFKATGLFEGTFNGQTVYAEPLGIKTRPSGFKKIRKQAKRLASVIFGR